MKINNDIPPFAEEAKIEQPTAQKVIEEILNKFKQPIPSNFLKLETKERNYMCSTTGWREPVCERYGFLVKEKWEQFDIPHTLLRKLELEKGKEITWPIYLSPSVLDKELIFGAYTIEDESEIFLNKPLTISSLPTEITRWLSEIENLKTQVTKLAEEKENNQETITNLQVEYNNLVGQITHLESLLVKERNFSSIQIAKLKEWKNQVKFELVPFLWPNAILTEDTPAAEILIEKIKELFLEKDLTEDLTKLKEERDDYQTKWDISLDELEEKGEIIRNYLLRIEWLEKEHENNRILRDQELTELRNKLTQKDTDLTNKQQEIKNLQNKLASLPTIDAWNNDWSKRPTLTSYNQIQTERDNWKTKYNNINSQLIITQAELAKEKGWWEEWFDDNEDKLAGHFYRKNWCWRNNALREHIVKNISPVNDEEVATFSVSLEYCELYRLKDFNNCWDNSNNHKLGETTSLKKGKMIIKAIYEYYRNK